MGPRGVPCVFSWAVLLTLLTHRCCLLLHSNFHGVPAFETLRLLLCFPCLL